MCIRDRYVTHDVSVRMAFGPVAVRNQNPAQPERPAFFQLMYIVALANTEVHLFSGRLRVARRNLQTIENQIVESPEEEKTGINCLRL